MEALACIWIVVTAFSMPRGASRLSAPFRSGWSFRRIISRPRRQVTSGAQQRPYPRRLVAAAAGVGQGASEDRHIRGDGFLGQYAEVATAIIIDEKTA